MLVDHNSMNLPLAIAGIPIRSLSWDDFKGTPPEDSPYAAHIYWNINYQFITCKEGKKPRLKVQVAVRPKSWRVKEELKLLQHEYGHYLIGCLCALAFLKRTSHDIKDPKTSYPDWYKQVLAACLKEYCAMQRQYDDQTDHNLNRTSQKEWEHKIQTMFSQFQTFFSSSNRQHSRKKQFVPSGRTLDSSQQARGLRGRNLSLKRDVKREVSTLPPLAAKGTGWRLEKQNYQPNRWEAAKREHGCEYKLD